MARPPIDLRRALAVCALAASLLMVLVAVPGRSQAATPELDTAWRLYYDGKSLTARKGLEAFLQTPAGQDLDRRREALEAMLEICVRSLSHPCLLEYAPQFGDAVQKTRTENDIQRIELARRAGYYFFASHLPSASPQALETFLKSGNWAWEHAYDEPLYLRRQVVAAHIHLRLGRPLEANRAVDKILSLTAALKNPGEDRTTVMWAVSDTMETLLAIGDAERAHGIFLATVGGMGKALSPLTVDAALYMLRSGEVLQAVGRGKDSLPALDYAVSIFDTIELDAEVRAALLVRALNAKAAACMALLDEACVRAALDRHPLAAAFVSPDRRAAGPEELAYLTLRGMAAGLTRTPDPVALAALKAPIGFTADDADLERLRAQQAVGVALASPPGKGRQPALLEAGRAIRALASRKADAPFGAWYRSGGLGQALVSIVLTQAEVDTSAEGADVIFALLQLSARQGQSFDADALTVLGQARDAAQRRTIHQALRLRARRDALERTTLRQIARQLPDSPLTGKALEQDFAVRARFRDYANRLEASRAVIAKDGAGGSGANLVSLRQLQAVLAADEAVLTLAPATGGLVYMCVRRDTTFRTVRPDRLGPNLLDIKLLQSALTAGHAPSESLDAQFPAAAAVRLYDALIRPFGACLRPGDHILWLPNLTAAGVPLAALLEQAPPRLGEGYDLSQAAWLVRRHAVTYAGSASAILAARAPRRPATPPLDFLGVGDPQLTGLTAGGEDRARIVLRGVRAGSALAALAPLPETRAELERSAAGFRSPRILTAAAATEGGVRREIIGAYRYLSFATHGLMREDVPGLSEPALALTPVSADDLSNDGLLTASEIADMNLAARFVALSACNTANYDLAQVAQDLPALASAFAVAGVPATLGTLWPVESETGKQVVAGTFERLRNGRGAAIALAESQRAFLAAPPGRAFLHPRFWAPFVLLGDGGEGAPPSPAPVLRVTSVEPIPDGRGEVLGVRRSGGRRLAQVMAADAQGAPGSMATALGPAGKTWARRNDAMGAAPFFTDLDGKLLVGGYMRPEPRRFVAALQSLDAATGAPIGAWRGEAIAEPLAIVLGGIKLDDKRALFGVGTRALPGQPADVRPKLYVYEVDAALAPRLLLATEAPSGAAIDTAVFARLGDDLLVSFSVLAALPYPEQAALVDEFETPDCGQESITRVQLHDLATGALKAKTDLRGHVVSAALALPGGEVLLGGSFKPACVADSRAMVLAVDARLSVRPFYQDVSLGASDVRTLSATGDGRVLLAASKDNTVDYAPAPASAQVTQAEVARLLYGGLLVLLDRKGAASPPTLLDAGTSLFVTASDASDPADILVGGAIGDTPVIFHLSAAR